MRLKAEYKDPGFGFRPGDTIYAVRAWQNMRNALDFLNALYERPSDLAGVRVTVIRDDAKLDLTVWPTLVNLEP